MSTNPGGSVPSPVPMPRASRWGDGCFLLQVTLDEVHVKKILLGTCLFLSFIAPTSFPPQWVMQGGLLAAGARMSDRCWQFPIDGHLGWTILGRSCASELKPL